MRRATLQPAVRLAVGLACSIVALSETRADDATPVPPPAETTQQALPVVVQPSAPPPVNAAPPPVNAVLPVQNIVPPPPQYVQPTSIQPPSDERQPSNLPPPYGASIWKVDIGGYAHISYRWVQQPENYNLAGGNSGFQLNQARVIVGVQYKRVLAARVSAEGASEDRINQSFPGGQLTPRLRDAYITWAPVRAFRVSVGQMVTPWDLDSMRSDAELPFVTRSVASEGVQPTEGYTTRGLGTDRNIGISIHSGFIPIGKMTSFRYSVFAGNGNGQNQVLNDNNLPAVFARAELSVFGKKGLPYDRVTPIYSVTDDWHKPIFNLGIAGQWNPRTVGNLPDLIRETDFGGAVDLVLNVFGIDLQGGAIYVQTTRDTLTASPALERFGWWGHLRYTLPKIPVSITPGYRVGSYSPRAHLLNDAATPADADVDAAYQLLYHTFGLTVRPLRTFPLKIGASYTLTTEKSPNELSNDRFEADIVAVF